MFHFKTSSMLMVTATVVAAVFASMTSATTMIPSQDLMGDWKMVELFDDQNEPVEIPTSPNGDGWVLHLSKRENSEDDKTLSLYTKIGNNLGGMVTLVDEDEDASTTDREQTIQVGPLRSTMMMPPPEMFQLEQYLTKYLSTMSTVKLSEDGDELVWMGTGRIVCQNVAKAAV